MLNVSLKSEWDKALKEQWVGQWNLIDFFRFFLFLFIMRQSQTEQHEVGYDYTLEGRTSVAAQHITYPLNYR